MIKLHFIVESDRNKANPTLKSVAKTLSHYYGIPIDELNFAVYPGDTLIDIARRLEKEIDQ